MSHNDLASPIPPFFNKDEKFFDKTDKKELKIIPAYGESPEEHHEWLKYQSALAELSPSLNACRESLIRFVFGAGLDFNKKSIAGYKPSDREEEDFADGEKDKLLQKLLTWKLTPLKILRAAKCIESFSFENNNKWIRVQLIKVNGADWKVNLFPTHYRNAAYLERKPKDLAYAGVICENFVQPDFLDGDELTGAIVRPITRYGIDDITYWDTKESKGVTIHETLIHATHLNCRGKYYDGSKIDKLIDVLNIEIKNLILMGKIANTEVISKNILLFEKIASDSGPGSGKSRSNGFRTIMKSMTRFMTNNYGRTDDRATSLFGIEYPKGNNPPTAIKLDVNRDKDYSEYSSSKAECHIHAQYGWSRILTNLEKTPGGIGADMKLNELICHSQTVDETREWYDNFFTWLIGEINLKIEGKPIDTGVKFNDTIQPLVDKLTAINGKRDNRQFGE